MKIETQIIKVKKIVNGEYIEQLAIYPFETKAQKYLERNIDKQFNVEIKIADMEMNQRRKTLFGVTQFLFNNFREDKITHFGIDSFRDFVSISVGWVRTYCDGDKVCFAPRSWSDSEDAEEWVNKCYLPIIKYACDYLQTDLNTIVKEMYGGVQ